MTTYRSDSDPMSDEDFRALTTPQLEFLTQLNFRILDAVTPFRERLAAAQRGTDSAAEAEALRQLHEEYARIKKADLEAYRYYARVCSVRW